YGVNDSKKLSEKRRAVLKPLIEAQAISFGIGIVDEQTIDRINILEATKEAMQKAVAALDPAPELLLIDALTIPQIHIPQQGIIKGDAKSVSIAAASILAKETRDAIMRAYDEIYPQYGFAKHKGYGTKEHIEAIRAYGPCPIHRRSFIKNFV
ncbi:MAG: ribonuclease HII, partial [Clostridiales bacterium]|nr:ribonuclease HII [Clostridiales bacterium]